MAFVHLHVHTEFSTLDGMARLRDLTQEAARLGMPALAITDHGTSAGWWKFANACREVGIKPIFGQEVYLAIGGDRRDPQVKFVRADDDTAIDSDEGEDSGATEGTKPKFYEHLTLLAMNEDGWTNIVKMTNAAQSTFSRKPLMDYKLIKEHSEGIIILTGCLGGPVLGPLAQGDTELARTNLQTMVDIVGKDRVFVEVMEHGIASETAAIGAAFALAKEFGLSVVVTNDSHYVHEHQDETHHAWTAMQSKRTVDDPKAYRFNGDGYHLRSEEEMRNLFLDKAAWQIACDNTVKVADLCDDNVVPNHGHMMPKAKLPEGVTDAHEFLRGLINKGARKRYGDKRMREDKELKVRIRHEFDTICGFKGTPDYADYFLILWELIEWAKSQDILVGPGRGSAAGSVVSYCLGIVDVDPIRHGLLFERFMEPGRAEMPDIDVDFQSSRRNEIYLHLQELYGFNHVARIGSFQIPKSPGSIKDAFKVLGLRVGDAERLTKQIARIQGRPDPFEKLLDEDYAGGDGWRRELERQGDSSRHAVELAQDFEGTAKNIGIHACGVVVSDHDLTELIPLRLDRRASQRASDGAKNEMWVTQWDSKDIDGFGLLKLDALVLRNLDVAATAGRLVERATGEHIDFYSLPDPDDKKDSRVHAAMDILRRGETASIFQMESEGMARLGTSIQPDCLDDLSAISALYRPGPLSANMHTRYAERKMGREPVDYSIFTPDKKEQEWLATVLERTYGVFCYQEQIMSLSGLIGGFDAKLRSKVRKAVSKKDAELLESLGALMIERAGQEFRDEHGNLFSPAFSERTARRVWELMRGSGDYLFNKSHSIAYGQITYMTAFLKANWPEIYGASLLANTDDTDKRLAMLKSLRAEGIEVDAPHINQSDYDTSVSEPNAEGRRIVMLGLGEIRGIGAQARTIVDERERGGPYSSLADIMERANPSVAAVEGLIEAGALDEFGPRYGLLMTARTRGAVSAFNCEWGILERTARQRSRLGVAFGDHPLATFRKELAAYRLPSPYPDLEGPRPVPLHTIGDGLKEGQTQRVVTLGILTRWKERAAARGRMASITIEGSQGPVDGVAWDKTLTRIKQSHGVPVEGSVVVVRGMAKKRMVEVRNDFGGDGVDNDDMDDIENAVPDEPVVIEKLEIIVDDCWTIELDSDAVEPSVQGQLSLSAILEAARTVELPVVKPRRPRGSRAEPVGPALRCYAEISGMVDYEVGKLSSAGERATAHIRQQMENPRVYEKLCAILAQGNLLLRHDETQAMLLIDPSRSVAPDIDTLNAFETDDWLELSDGWKASFYRVTKPLQNT